ncbi:hypothetical protein PC129_g15833 [Phytophthora cactorum]|uniref:Uncharacterized protein n=2 Tax=Phytophthora cactorum TaxID=29920 RepID=A0A8T1ALY8_9STRA|nr:hypothetical protein Pcac1_g6007 [Phytophthora cactorum]KAG2807337.1 hypothetical protein PC112_g17448 [Phytophthora cactorum]KAG2809252.1 hypothetical protein PC111_g16123 [Phytophthora cactorum]KAG2848745.1 hypothetical protein PC113_g17510 [Phytophthora cactorum]KAG2884373.1 hypothetical protein PC115_g21354 [Phytophthora cactorum]
MLDSKMSSAGGCEVIDVVSSDDPSSDEVDMDAIDLTVSSEEGSDGDNEDARGDSPKKQKLEVVSVAEASVKAYKTREREHKQIRKKNNPWPSKLSRKSTRSN